LINFYFSAYGGGNGYSNSYNYNNPQQSHVQQGYSQAPFQPPQSSFQPPQNSALGSTAFPAAQFIKDPFIANAAMQYGQNLVGQGQQFIDQNLEKYMSVSKVKYYFAVDTRYVMKKIQLIFFPFAHSVSSILLLPFLYFYYSFFFVWHAQNSNFRISLYSLTSHLISDTVPCR
jgi:hypothetical protein